MISDDLATVNNDAEWAEILPRKSTDWNEVEAILGDETVSVEQLQKAVAALLRLLAHQINTVPSISGNVNLAGNLEMVDYKVIRNSPRNNYMSCFDGTYGSVHLFASQGGITFHGSGGGNPGTRVVAGNFGVMTGTPAEKCDIDGNVNVTGVYKVDGVQVLGPQQGGWQPMSGTPNSESLYDTETITLSQAGRRLKAIQDALAVHGIILEDI